MNYKSLALLLATAFASEVCLAQAVVEDFKTTPTTQEGKRFPLVNSEGRVRTSVTAIDAKKVQIDIGGKKYDLKNDGNGVWTGESDPQDVGFHYYQLNIDGASVPDPNSLYYFGASRWGSGIEIPSNDLDFFALKNVPHGMMCETFYFSKTSNSVRRAYVYLPPGYDKDATKKYPVLYLQHGMGENETGWGSQGYTARIMDNLIAEGKALPFIIVMENSSNQGGGRQGGGQRPAGMGAPAGAPAGAPQGAPTAAAQGAPAGAPQGAPGAGRPAGGGFGGGAGMAGQFGTILLEDLIPYIEANFRVIPNQANRAMAGLSMGGMQTKSIVIANPDKFSRIGMFSSGTIKPSEITDIDAFKKNVKLVFMSFGGKEGGSANIGPAAAEWNAVGIKGVSYVSEGTAHEWHSWRRSLHQFAQLLFK